MRARMILTCSGPARTDKCLLILMAFVLLVCNVALLGLFMIQSGDFDSFQITFHRVRGLKKAVTLVPTTVASTLKPMSDVVMNHVAVNDVGISGIKPLKDPRLTRLDMTNPVRPQFEIKLKEPPVDHRPPPPPRRPPPVNTVAPSKLPAFRKTYYENSSYIDLRNMADEFVDECGSCKWTEKKIPWPENYVSERPWLLVVMPTVPRKKHYLARTLRSIDLQMPKSTNLMKVAVVWNMKNETQVSFERNGTQMIRYEKTLAPKHEDFELQSFERKHDDRFDFIKTINPLPFTNGSSITTDQDLPGPKVRAQTRDVSNTLRVAYEKYRPHYVMFMEDDFIWCDSALQMMVYMIRRSACLWKESGGWIVHRFSFGFNGIVLHGYDIPTLAAYLAKHQTRRPPDHLMVEWFAGETRESQVHKRSRQHVTFRYNLLEHTGVISSIRDVPQTLYVNCWKGIETPVNFDVELFDKKCIGTAKTVLEDLSPCTSNVTDCPAWFTAKNFTRRGF